MSGATVSRPLQFACLLSAALTAVALLQVPADLEDAEALPPRPVSVDRPVPATGDAALQPWVRALLPLPAARVAPAAANMVTHVPAPPPQVLAATPLQPIEDTVPDPSVVYLGRMEREGRRHVFLARGAASLVVEVGGQIDPQWRLVDAGASQLELLYLPLNISKTVAVPSQP